MEKKTKKKETTKKKADRIVPLKRNKTERKKKEPTWSSH